MLLNFSFYSTYKELKRDWLNNGWMSLWSFYSTYKELKRDILLVH